MMSRKERRRMAVLGQVQAGQLTVAAAGRRLGLSERQTRRIWQRYQQQGDAGLVHRLRGRPSNRGQDLRLRQQAVSLYRQHYVDFGCTLACEYLSQRHGLVVDDQTLRRWLAAEGLWQRRRRGPTPRRRRERRACFGDLVQLDGSEHDWFEGRLRKMADGTTASASRCVLMVMIDDATGRTLAQFFASETAAAALTIFRRWALAYGLPQTLYPDRHSIYRVNDRAADEVEARTGRRPLTQMGRALAELGVRLTCAKSPQAKGRVERMNGTLQDRLVKALRIEGISDIAAANAYLAQTFLPQLNARFTVRPAGDEDRHMPTTAAELDAALCLKQTRQVGRDQCLSYGGQVLQLTPPTRGPSLAGKRVMVHQALDGTLTVHWHNQVIVHQLLAQRPKATAVKPTAAQRVATHQPLFKPAVNHPWRTPGQRCVRRRQSGSATARATPSPPLRQPAAAG